MKDQTPKYAILLDSAVGYKEPGLLKDAKDFVLGKPKQYSQKNIISGTLLEALSEKEILLLAPHFDPILNYKVLSSDPTVWLHCTSKQVKRLNHEELKYLQAVKSFNGRLKALPKLDWIGSLHVGSGVYLNIPTVYGRLLKVTIRYIGSLPSEDHLGTNFGVELLVSIVFKMLLALNCRQLHMCVLEQHCAKVVHFLRLETFLCTMYSLGF